MKARRVRTVIAWSGLPTYAARLLRPLVARHDVSVIASRAQFHYEGVEADLGAPVHWIDESRPTSWAEIGLPPPELFIHTGWNIPAFNSLAVEAAAAGAWRVPMIDNNWKGTPRQYAGLLVFRGMMRRKFDRVIVPGRAGVKFVRRLGVASPRIFTGMYGADAGLFTPGLPGSRREKRCIFIGQLIERKGIREMIAAWKASGAAGLGWELRCFGAGPLEGLLRDVAGVTYGGFAQAGELSVELAQARALLLPSREEHWGVVVHEAALSGCALLVSAAAGAAEDLVVPNNGSTFRPRGQAALTRALRLLLSRPPDWFDRASRQSLLLAAQYGPARWLEMYESLCAELPKTERAPRVSSPSHRP